MTKYTDYYFTAPSFELFKLEFLGFYDEERELFHGHNVDFDFNIPVILVPATYDENGEVLTNPVFSTSYHVNVRVIEDYYDFSDRLYMTGWKNSEGDSVGLPETPNRVWA